MTPKRRLVVKICLIIYVLSMVVLAVSTVIQVIHNGWDSINAYSFVPLSGGFVVLIALLADKKEKQKK